MRAMGDCKVSRYDELKEKLRGNQYTWLITGVAGFIGSNLLEMLLGCNQRVVGLDNLSTGHMSNIEQVLQSSVLDNQSEQFAFIKGDITNLDTCRSACEGVDFVLHQAALGSVPRSIEDPIRTNASNIDGFLNMLVSAKDAGVKRFVYAASSSTYGDHPDLPKVEDTIGNPLSPYAVTKVVNELYADVFNRVYGFKCIGLRYFNIFGRRQDPNGAYAAVIPKWVGSLLKGEEIFINGDGETSRDFCYIDNAVQMNILAAMTDDEAATGQVYNVALNDRTSLTQLFNMIQERLVKQVDGLTPVSPTYRDFRAGDVKHSLADISKAVDLLGYAPSHRIEEGLDEALEWYMENLLS